MQETKSAYAYVRVSTDKQEDLSPDAQVRLIKEYASKNNIIIEEIFIENAISGRKADKRPKFMEMVGKAKEKDSNINLILVWKFSRFARNQEESIVYKSLLKKQSNIDVVSVSEPLIDGPFGSLIERIIEWMDEYYSIRLSGEVLRGLTEKVLKGGYVSNPPIGYIKEHRKTPVIHPEEAAIIYRIFDQYVNTSLTIRDIAIKLNQEGFRTRNNQKFEFNTLKYIIENPFYIGKIRFNYKTDNETIIVDGSHESIVSDDWWNKAQERIKKNIKKPYRQRAVSTNKHWLSGVIVCSSCGRSLSFNSTSNKWGNVIGFQCWGYSKGFCTISHALSPQKALIGVINGLEQYIQSAGFQYRTIMSEDSKEIQIDSLKSRLKEIDKKMIRIKTAYRDGIDTLDEYKENKMLLDAEREEIEMRINTFNLDKVTLITTLTKKDAVETIQGVIDQLKNETLDMVTKGNALRSVCPKIVFNKQEQHMDFYIEIAR